MFFAFKRPIYREVEYRELRNKILHPDSVKNLLDKNITLSTNETDSKCQGGDFMLQEKIKRQKELVPKGVVSSKTWQRVFHSIDKVEDIVDNAKTKLGISSLALARNILLEKEIVEWCALLRISSFISNTRCASARNIYGEKFSVDIIDFANNVSNKRK